MKIKRIIALGLAGCLLFSSTALANPAAEIVKDPTVIEAPAGSGVTITEEKISLINDLIEIDIEYPVISGLSDAAFEKELNDSIKNEVSKIKNEMEADVEEYYKEAIENDYPIRQHLLLSEYDVRTNNDDFLSFTMTYYTYTGGANGMTLIKPYNINKNANASFHLKDLFKRDANYKEVINAEITKQIGIRSDGENEMFFEGEMGFQGIKDEQDFYLTDDKLIIFFEKYEIAPGVMGLPEFEISLAGWQDILRDPSDFTDETELVVDWKISKINGVDMIPLREVVEDLGYKVEWNASDRSILISRGEATVKLKIGDNVYIANHKIPYDLGFAPVIVDGSTYVPLSFYQEILMVNEK